MTQTLNAIPSVGPFVGDAPEDRHAERVVGEMLTCLDDFAATVEPQLDARLATTNPTPSSSTFCKPPGRCRARSRFC
jgi:hypothetical protein